MNFPKNQKYKDVIDELPQKTKSTKTSLTNFPKNQMFEDVIDEFPRKQKSSSALL